VFSGVAVPVGETSESYELEVWNSTYATLKRTFSGLTSPSATYTAVQQVSDFGLNQETLYLKWYQLSSVVGRGVPLTQSITRVSASDPYGEWVTLLMRMNDTALADYIGHTVTKNGNVQRVTEAAAFDGYAADFDGTGDYLSFSYVTADFDWWTTSTTIEFFIIVDDLSTTSYLDGPNPRSVIIGNGDPASSVNYWSFGPISDGTLRFVYWNGSSQQVLSSGGITAGVRTHLALCIDSSGIRLYMAGNRDGTGTVAGTPQTSVSYPLTIGQINNRSLNGRIDNLRITHGGATARYTGTTYTVPTTAFPDP
jgi:hypothetical protein